MTRAVALLALVAAVAATLPDVKRDDRVVGHALIPSP